MKPSERTATYRMPTAQRGRRVTFHGAFASKADAVAKERAVHGFIRPTQVRGQRRYTVMTRNPTIPGRVREIRYQRTGRNAGAYYHRFKEPVAMRANRDGSVTLKARRRLWADDREPEFDRYVTRGRRNPMAKGGGSGLGWFLAAVGVVLVLKPDLLTGLFTGLGGPSTASLGVQQQPQGYWFNPDTLSLVYQLGLTPPAAGYRSASQYEVSTYYPGNM